MANFDLRQTVRDVAGHTSETDPARIAEAVFDAIDSDDRAAALAAALPIVVTQVLGQMRMSARRPAWLHEGGSGAPRKPRDTTRPAGSAKVAAIRHEMWRRRLRENIWVGADGGHARKFLADCTVADLDRAIGLRRTIAGRNLSMAEDYQRLRTALDADARAKVVADLPEAVLASLLGGEAAA